MDFNLLLAANLVMSRLGIKTAPYRNLTELGADLSTLFANPANTITRDIDPAPASHDAGNIGRLFEGHHEEQPGPSSHAQAVTTAVNELCSTQQIKFSKIKELLRNFKCDDDSLIQDSLSKLAQQIQGLLKSDKQSFIFASHDAHLPIAKMLNPTQQQETITKILLKLRAISLSYPIEKPINCTPS